MIKSELVARLAERHPYLTQAKAERAINAMLDRIADGLAASARVELRDFGSFTARQWEARIGRNPRTGESVAVEAKANIHFRPGKGLAELLNRQPITPGRKARPLLKVPRG